MLRLACHAKAGCGLTPAMLIRHGQSSSKTLQSPSGTTLSSFWASEDPLATDTHASGGETPRHVLIVNPSRPANPVAFSGSCL